MWALGNTAVEACRPARLKVLVPEMPVTTYRAASGDTVAVGVCFLPWKIRSEWISSENRTTWCFMHSSTMRRSSSGVQTMPRGLWGLHSRNRSASSSLASKSAQSISHLPSFSTNWFSSTLRFQASVMS